METIQKIVTSEQTVRLNPVAVNTAIRWMIWRIEKNGGKFADKVKFGKEISTYLKNAVKVTKQSAVLVTTPTFINKKKQGRSLADIFQRNGIEEKYISQFSITISNQHVLIADGHSAVKNVVEYNECTKRFEYKPVKALNPYRY